MKKIIVIGIILLFLGSNVPVFAETESFVYKTIPSRSASSAENYTVDIGAGFYREHGGKIGLGWHMSVENTGDTNITGFFYERETTLFGKILNNGSDPFSLRPGSGVSTASFIVLGLHRIWLLNLTVVVENMTYSKSGYWIGPLVLLVD